MSGSLSYAQPRTFNARSRLANEENVKGAGFDMAGNMVSGRNPATGRPLSFPTPRSALDIEGERLGWNKPKPSPYRDALAAAVV